MSDLIERLRWTGIYDQAPLADLLTEAADKIEEQQGRIKKIEANADYHADVNVRLIARIAELEGDCARLQAVANLLARHDKALPADKD